MVEVLCGFGVLVVLVLSIYVVLQYLAMDRQPFSQHPRPFLLGMIFAGEGQSVRIACKKQHAARITKALDLKGEWE